MSLPARHDQTSYKIYLPETFTTHGTPQNWLDRYGLADDITDPDGDGMPSWAERQAGTDPTRRESVLAITNANRIAAPGGNGFVVRWPSAVSRTYVLDRTTNLLLRDFAPVATNLPATPPSNVFTDAPSVLPAAAYRVRITTPP